MALYFEVKEWFLPGHKSAHNLSKDLVGVLESCMKPGLFESSLETVRFVTAGSI